MKISSTNCRENLYTKENERNMGTKENDRRTIYF